MGHRSNQGAGKIGTPAPEELARAERSDRRQTILIVAVTVAVILSVIVAAILLGGEEAGSGDTVGAITYEEFATDAPLPNADMEAIRDEIDSMSVLDFKETVRRTEYVKISVKDYGDIVIRLRADIAPETVANFQKLVGECRGRARGCGSPAIRAPSRSSPCMAQRAAR